MMLLNKDQLERGGIYALRSRNLLVGAYDGDRGFIGIREKFGSEYLFTEYLARERGGEPGCDTVHPLELIGTLPDGVALRVSGDPESRCDDCGKRAWWTGPPPPAPWACEGGCETTKPRGTQNDQLFDLLKPANDAIGGKS